MNLGPDLTGHLEERLMQTVELNVQGMTCGSCVKHVTAALNQLPGVTAVEVDLSVGRVSIMGSTAAEELISALETAGYSAQTVNTNANDTKPTNSSNKGGCCGR